MDINTYIESGVLELYIAGALSDAENKEVYDMILKHPEILKEVLEIENAVVKLTASTSTKISSHNFEAIKEKLGLTDDSSKVVTMKPKYNWITYTGWAATIVLGGGVLWTLNQNNELIGTITEVVEIPQNVLLAVNHNDREILIPFHDDIIIKVNEKKSTISIHIIDGLLDL